MPGSTAIDHHVEYRNLVVRITLSESLTSAGITFFQITLTGCRNHVFLLTVGYFRRRIVVERPWMRFVRLSSASTSMRSRDKESPSRREIDLSSIGTRQYLPIESTRFPVRNLNSLYPVNVFTNSAEICPLRSFPLDLSSDRCHFPLSNRKLTTDGL